MIELKSYKGKLLTSAKDIHKYLEIKTWFSAWFKIASKNAGLQIDKDFLSYKYESTGGRPFTDYYLEKNAAIKIIVQSRIPKSLNLVDYLIAEYEKRQNLEYITPKEAALAYEFINFFKFVDNQKIAYQLYKKHFIENAKNPLSKHVYSEFAQYRTSIIGYDKKKVDEILKDYLKTHAGHNLTRLMKKNMSEKLSVINVNEAIRVSVLDLLFSRGTEKEIAYKFSNMVKNVSKEMKILARRKNEKNIFEEKEDIKNLKELK